jgi:hypothetical protein
LTVKLDHSTVKLDHSTTNLGNSTVNLDGGKYQNSKSNILRENESFRDCGVKKY